MCQPAFSISSFEFTDDGLQLNRMKKETEPLIKNEPDNQEWEHLEKKYQIKNEEVEISDEKYNNFNHDLGRSLFNERCITKNVKFENSNDGDMTNVKNEEQFSMVTKNETSTASRKALKCTLCSYSCQFLYKIKEHFRQVHSGIRKFGCSHCDYVAKRNSHLKRHILKKHACKSGVVKSSSKMTAENETSIAPRKLIKCTLCSFTGKYPYQIKEHFREVHSNIRDFGCPDCDYTAKRHTHLKYHILTKHGYKSGGLVRRGSEMVPPEETLLKCTLCPFTSKWPSNMKNHFGKVHSRALFHCPDCDFVGKRQLALNRHILRKHEDKSGKVRTRAVCSVCGKEFTERGTLTDHIRRIHLNVNMKCPECDYQTMHRGVLRSHILLVHHPENLFRCHNCGYTSSRKTYLREHILQQHMLNITHIFKCQYCPHTSKYKNGLREHIKVQHGKERPFTCSLCGNKYRFSKNLNNHVNLKHNKLEFVQCVTNTSLVMRQA